MTPDPHTADFTEQSYRRIVATAKLRWRFEPFGTKCEQAHVLWRHDVDFSVHRALRLAEIEADEGVRATYLLSFHSTFYNLLERSVAERARRIVALGHRLGLHFDSAFYGDPGSANVLAERVSSEAQLLSDLIEHELDAVSFHNPDIGTPVVGIDVDEIAGLVNAYGRTLWERYTYVSDSNGYWRFRRLPDVVSEGSHDRLHVLTHPEWWQRRPMPARDRVARCIEGRASDTLNDYDRLLAEAGRRNLRS